MRASTDHVRIRNADGGGAFVAFCEHCRQQTLIPLPVSVDSIVDLVDRFIEIHRKCKRSAI